MVNSQRLSFLSFYILPLASSVFSAHIPILLLLLVLPFSLHMLLFNYSKLHLPSRPSHIEATLKLPNHLPLSLPPIPDANHHTISKMLSQDSKTPPIDSTIVHKYGVWEPTHLLCSHLYFTISSFFSASCFSCSPALYFFLLFLYHVHISSVPISYRTIVNHEPYGIGNAALDIS